MFSKLKKSIGAMLTALLVLSLGLSVTPVTNAQSNPTTLTWPATASFGQVLIVVLPSGEISEQTFSAGVPPTFNLTENLADG